MKSSLKKMRGFVLHKHRSKDKRYFNGLAQVDELAQACKSRILMAMARDGLLPQFFSDVNKRTQVPIKSTILTGIGAALLAFFMDVSQLAGMVSVGTLLAFTVVAVSILILRYVPPDEMPLPSSLQDSIDAVSLLYGSQKIVGKKLKDPVGTSDDSNQPAKRKVEAPRVPLIVKEVDQVGKLNEERRRIAAWNIASVCIGVLLLTSSASAEILPNVLRFSVCGLGGVLLLCGLIALSWIDQDDARHSFGHTGGFICPFVPVLPVACILINVYLMINLGSGTWIRVSVWMVGGIFIYLFYGRRHSLLLDAVYVPAAHAEEIYRSSVEQLA